MSNGDRLPGPASGDPALDDLSRRYYGVLLRYFARRGATVHDAQDLAQEVFAKLSDGVGLGGARNPEGYLFAVAANALRDQARHRKVRAAHSVEAGIDAAQRVEDFTPERLLQGRQELNWIVSALNEMPERMRNIFILARLENLPRAEIAQRLGISKRSVEQQITLATMCLADRRRRIT